METQVSTSLNLDAIAFSTTNKLFRTAKEISDESLVELTCSIRQHGVIQPVLVRPGENQNNYILICGERRVRASRLAGLKEIPVEIREATDETALILQITENVQRADVHPLNEAKGYKLLLESDSTMTTNDMAVRFGKSETYILQRLKLNDLRKEAKKDFYEGRMNLTHAIILARLTHADQFQLMEELESSRQGFGSASQLLEYINQNIMNVLSKAPFDLEDQELHKKAGSCMTCPKRSGASPLLFSDIQAKDRCFDRACFLTKCNKFLLQRTKEVIETQPEIFLLYNYNFPSDEIVEILQKHPDVKPLKEYDDFNTQNTGGKKVKGLWIGGNLAGHTVSVYLSEKAKQKAEEVDNPKVVIEKIQSRVKRGVELDKEKVYARILECLKDHPSQKKNFNKKLMPDEEVFQWFLILDRAGYALKNELLSLLSLSKLQPEKVYEKLKKLKAEEKAFIVRKVMLDQYGGNYPDSPYAYIIRKIAQGYKDVNISEFESEQTLIRERREARAKDRIRSLKEEAKG